jgi:hypothetical protein
MPPPTRTARLHDVLERAARRVAQADALLRRADETRTRAWLALERSQHLLAQLERSQAGDQPESTPVPPPSPSTREERHAQDV